MNDLVPYIESVSRVKDRKDHVGGISMGGMVRLDLFCILPITLAGHFALAFRLDNTC